MKSSRNLFGNFSMNSFRNSSKSSFRHSCISSEISPSFPSAISIGPFKKSSSSKYYFDIFFTWIAAVILSAFPSETRRRLFFQKFIQGFPQKRLQGILLDTAVAWSHGKHPDWHPTKIGHIIYLQKIVGIFFFNFFQKLFFGVLKNTNFPFIDFLKVFFIRVFP